MWAQLIKMRLKPGKEAGLESLLEHLQATEQPGSGLVRSTTMTDQKDPSWVYTMVVFESEEQARAREQDQRRTQGLQNVRATMAEMFEGAPEFVDLNVVTEVAT
jgi:antibiotic biosynthesis monooxygenase (ABM) superfamily enzyme